MCHIWLRENNITERKPVSNWGCLMRVSRSWENQSVMFAVCPASWKWSTEGRYQDRVLSVLPWECRESGVWICVHTCNMCTRVWLCSIKHKDLGGDKFLPTPTWFFLIVLSSERATGHSKVWSELHWRQLVPAYCVEPSFLINLGRATS